MTATAPQSGPLKYDQHIINVFIPIPQPAINKDGFEKSSNTTLLLNFYKVYAW